MIIIPVNTDSNGGHVTEHEAFVFFEAFVIMSVLMMSYDIAIAIRDSKRKNILRAIVKRFSILGDQTFVGMLGLVMLCMCLGCGALALIIHVLQ